MGTPTIPLAIAAEAIRRVEEKLRLGFRKPDEWVDGAKSAIEEAARQAVEDGWINSTSCFKNRIKAAKRWHNLEPDWSEYRPARYQQPQPKLLLYAPDPPSLPETGPGERVLVIGDLHQDPRHPHRLDVLTWIARYASEHRIPRIIQVGDWSTWDSVSQHDRNDTQKGRLKPKIQADQDNLLASHQAFERGRDPAYKPRRIFLRGNHEYRVERYENQNPESYGIHTTARDQTFLQFGWNARPYGELYYCQDVAFTHHPINGAGRAYGGKTGPQRAANDTTVSMVSGHTHRLQLYSTPKNGKRDRLSMIEVGCALPWGEFEHYVDLTPTGWWWGIVPMTVCEGDITDVNAVSMKALRDRYSDAGGDVKSAA